MIFHYPGKRDVEIQISLAMPIEKYSTIHAIECTLTLKDIQDLTKLPMGSADFTLKRIRDACR